MASPIFAALAAPARNLLESRIRIFRSGECRPRKTQIGQVAEWLKAHAWKACIRE